MSAHGQFGIRRWVNSVTGQEGITFWCHGCECAHSVAVKGGDPDRNWHFNGDYDAPILSPSVHVIIPAHDYEGKQYPQKTLCHSFVGCNGAQPGEIIFLDDCDHSLRGVHKLQPWPSHYGFAEES